MLEASHIGKSRVHDGFLAARGLRRLDPRDAVIPDRESLTHLAVQFPGEHCTECAAPDCHDSCDLFERGCTGRCKRFVDGIVLQKSGIDLTPYCLEVLFKPWGQLFCIGNAWCVDRRRHRTLTRACALLGRIIMAVQAAFRWLPNHVQWRLTDRMRGAGNRIPRMLNARASRPGAMAADALLCVIGNPHAGDVSAEITLSGFENSQGGRSFRRTAILRHGWNVVSIPFADIREVIDPASLFRVCLVPLIEEPRLLQILCFGFAAWGVAAHSRTERAHPARPDHSRDPLRESAKKVKLAVFDLDNTLWDGIVIEDPEREYELKPGVVDALKELDRRGILLSVASKNNVADARPLLERLGIWDLFLHPQINWQPKSIGIMRIVHTLNVGMDSVAFVDDSEFERAEIRAALPDVRTFDAAELTGLPSQREFEVPVTAESGRRRQFYRDEQQRRSQLDGSGKDYDTFLRSCGMKLRLEGLEDDNRERVYELVQRTNQLNFSGNHYAREDLDRLLADGNVMPVVMRCEDRFGDYGIVGFAMIEEGEHSIDVLDLMFSCRIQGKRVEHGVFEFLRARAATRGLQGVTCHLRRTERNAPAVRVLADLGFSSRGETGEGDELQFLAVDRVADSLPVAVIVSPGCFNAEHGRGGEAGSEAE